MATYKPKKKIDNNGTLEEVKIPIDSVDGLADEFKKKGVHFISDSDITVTAGSSSPKLSEKWVVNGVDGITEPFDGMIVAIRMPSRLEYPTGTVLSIDGGNSYNPITLNTESDVGNFGHSYQTFSTIFFVFNSVQKRLAYLESDVMVIKTGCWNVADRDSDKNVSQWESTENFDRPVLIKTGSDMSSITGDTRFSPNVTVNPSTGTLSATAFKENGVSLADKYATKEEASGSGTGVENIKGIDTWYDSPRDVEFAEGISWVDDFAIYDQNDSQITTGEIYHKVPIAAGEGIEFEPDTTTNVVKINATGGGGGSASFANDMPIIRLITVSDMDRTGVVSPTNPIRVTIEVVGGTILPTDKIQLCSKKSMTYKLHDEYIDDEGNPASRKKGRRWRLRPFASKTAEECHPDGVLDNQYRLIAWGEDDYYIAREFLRSGNCYDRQKTVTKYVRVSRIGAKSEGDTHSNAVPFTFSICNLSRSESGLKDTAKINIM